MFEFLLTLAAALPFLMLIYWLQSPEKGSPRPLFQLFAIGLTAPAAAAAAELLSIPICGLFPAALVVPAKAFIGIALIEELIKLTAMMLAAQRLPLHGSASIGAVYGMCTAMGFALSENIIYLIGADSALRLALLRGFTAMPLHLLTGAITGLAWARVKMASRGSTVPALLLATAIHGCYNFISLADPLPGYLRIVLLGLGWFGMLFHLHRLRRGEKNDF
ncbi:MAG: hypothetical protein B0D92_08455 [Spirochaeta sp. LUC14_002_19_P3]|nr:MAG: hypothetical protein B0D92_08455 [Spirochaeta sp. LUC14_002_19_P3]